MRNRAIVLLFLLLAVFGLQNALAIDCAEFTPTIDGRCMYRVVIPWVAFGGGWESRLKMSNIKQDPSFPSDPLQLDFFIWNADGKTTAKFYSTYNRFNYQPQLGGGWSYPLLPGESVEVRLLYPAACVPDTLDCQPDPGTLATGSLVISYITYNDYGNNVNALRGLAKAQVQFLSKGPDGSFRWQATEREQPPATVWIFPFGETFDKAANWQEAQNTSFAVANAGNTPIQARVTMIDQYRKVVAENSVYLKVHETRGYVLADFFKGQLPEKDLSGWIIVQQDDISPTNPAGGLLAVTAFQVIGDSMGSLDVQSIKAQ